MRAELSPLMMFPLGRRASDSEAQWLGPPATEAFVLKVRSSVPVERLYFLTPESPKKPAR